MSTGLKRIALTASLLLALADIAWATEPAPPLLLHETPRPIPSLVVGDDEGRDRTLAEFRGRVVLLNVWATWCAPCRKEMPTLDRLEAMLGRPDFTVVALSIDPGGLGPVRRFFSEIGVTRLGLFIDERGRTLSQLGAYGLPTTILVGPDGREVGRLVGPTEWNSPEMTSFLRNYIDSARNLPRHSGIQANKPLTKETRS